MVERFGIENECFAPGCDEVAELVVSVTITDFACGITLELCAKHSETLAPELMRIYHTARKRWRDERDEAKREAKARKEQMRPKVLERSDGETTRQAGEQDVGCELRNTEMTNQAKANRAGPGGRVLSAVLNKTRF